MIKYFSVMKKFFKILKSRWFIYGSLSIVTFLVLVFPNTIKYYARKLLHAKNVYSVVKRYEKEVDSRLKPHYENASIQYPGKKLTFLINKDKLTLKLYAGTNFGKMRLIKTYPILANSGLPGPKLKQGDQQIPEGIYKIEYFNPNSRYHLSMKINYPNAFDLEMAKQDKRNKPGYDIFIHGKNVSIGCVAIGDPGIEELFVLSNSVSKENIKVIIIPNNFKEQSKIDKILKRSPEWTKKLYGDLQQELNKI